MKNIIRLLKIIGAAWPAMAGAAALGYLTVAGSMGLLAVSAYLISAAALHPSITELSTAIVGVRFFGISRAVCRYLERYISHDATFRLLEHLRVWFYRRLAELPALSLQQRHSGELLQAIVGDVEVLKEFYLRVLAPPLVAVLSLATAAALLGKFSAALVCALAIGFMLAGVFLPFVLHWLQRQCGRQLVMARTAFKERLVDYLNGMTEVTVFNRGAAAAGELEELSRVLLKAQSRTAQFSAVAEAAALLTVNLTVWVILWLALPLVENGSLPGVYLAAVVLLVQSSFEAVLPLPLAMHHLRESTAAAGRLFALADRAPEAGCAEKPAAAFGPLVLEGVGFAYETGNLQALQDITFSVQPGQRVAIVGPSGAGKSTLVKLLLGFFPPDSGRLLLHGRELTEYDEDSLRRLLGAAAQHTHVFNASIRDNILLARPQASEKQLQEAVCKAQLQEFIESLPEGLDTMTGQNGFALSGGQRQRLALARVLLKEAPLLILDEPSAGLDAVTEREFMQTLKNLWAGRTVLLITHRLTGLEDMDEVIVLEKGRIAERGSFAALMAADGLLSKMWHLQHDML